MSPVERLLLALALGLPERVRLVWVLGGDSDGVLGVDVSGELDSTINDDGAVDVLYLATILENDYLLEILQIQ